MSNGLIAGAYDEARQARAGADTLQERLTATRAGYLDRLDHPILDAVGPTHARLTSISGGQGEVANGYSNLANYIGMPAVSLPTGGALQTVISVTGSGVLLLAAVGAAGSGVTVSVRVTCDGVMVVNRSALAISTSAALGLVGMVSGVNGMAPGLLAVPFRASLLIEGFCAVANYGKLFAMYALTEAPV